MIAKDKKTAIIKEYALKEGDPWAETCVFRLKNWRKVAGYIRENYEVSDDMKTVFVRVWW